ncbi:MAG: hypothetical protein R3F11_27320 [Verrucomicrobiales bacterium]
MPLVELRTVHGEKFVPDNAGLIAFDLPELTDRETWFWVRGFGYGVPKGGFGYEGVRLTPKPGGSLKIEVARRIVAKRLGRIPGAGIFAESHRMGEARIGRSPAWSAATASRTRWLAASLSWGMR